MAHGPKLRWWPIFESNVASCRKSFRWLASAGAVLCALCFSACMLSFDDYAEGDPCAASLDAGIRTGTAPDPVLRGCDAGVPKNHDDDPSTGDADASDTDAINDDSDASDRASGAGASGMAGEP